MSVMQHPREPDLQAYFDGELPEADAARLREHLETCAACRGVLDELQAVRDAMARDELAPGPEPVWPLIQDQLAGRSGRPFSPLFAAGTAAACLAGLVLGLLLGTPDARDLTDQDPLTRGTVDRLWPATSSSSLLDIYTGALAQERSEG